MSAGVTRYNHKVLSAAAGGVVLLLAGSVGGFADVSISSGQTQNMSCSGGVCAPTATSATLNVNDLENLLAASDVKVATTNGSVEANNIDVNAAFSWSALTALTLDAHQSITFSAVIDDAGSGGVSLITNDGGSGGTLSFTINQGRLDFSNSKAALFINGAKYRLEKNMKELVLDIAIKPGGHFALSNNIDARTNGLYYNSPIPIPFGGSFNGLGHQVANLAVAGVTDADIGLFADIKSSGVVASVTLSHVSMVSQSNGGALAGYNDGTIINCASSGEVGGIIAGGLVGFNNTGTIAASQSNATVRANDNTGGDVNAGGLAGDNYGIISGSFATGKVTGRTAIGGLIGGNAATVENSYATGEVRGTQGSLIGGFVGYTRGNIGTSYSIGSVSSRKKHPAYIGGFDGQNDSGTDANSYWDTDTSGQTEGSGDGNDAGLTGLTTQQLQSGLPAGFDPTIWAEAQGVNNGFPYLIANPPE